MSEVKKTPVIYEVKKKSISNNNDYISENFKTKATDSERNILKRTVKEKLGEEHPFDYKIIENLSKKFAIISAIIDKIHDFTIGPGIKIESKNKRLKEILEKWMKKTKFKSKIGPWFKEGLSKGSSYLEVAGLSDRTKENIIKNVNTDTIFIKKDEFGEIIEYNQLIGDNLSKINDDDIIKLIKEDIIQLDINKIGSGVYGYGIVYSGLGIINDFLQSQKSVHKIMERKANSQLHVKLGDSDKEDYPEQSDIDAFGSKLQFMNNTTEWVTGPNVEMNVIDFGNIGEKFASILENDLKLLSYSFQVPETILGASSGGGLNTGGHADVQMDAFERNIKSYQEQLSFVISAKIFDLVLANEGIINIDYEVLWGELSEEDKREKIKVYSELLGKPTISEGLRRQIEKRIATIDDFDLDEIEAENKRMERRKRHDDNRNFQRQLQLNGAKQNNQSTEEDIKDIIKLGLNEGKAPQEIEMEIISEFDNISEEKIREIINNILKNDE